MPLLQTVLGPTIGQVVVGEMLVMLVQKVFEELKDVQVIKGKEWKEKPGTVFRG